MNEAAKIDHVHQGVHKLLAGTNITLTPAGGLGDVKIDATAPAPNKLARMEFTFDRTAAVADGDQDITCVSADDGASFIPTALTLHAGRTGNTTQIGSFGQAILVNGNSVTEQGMLYCFGDTVARSYIGITAYLFVSGGGQWVGTLANSGTTTKVRIGWVKHPVNGGLDITCSIIIHGVKV